MDTVKGLVRTKSFWVFIAVALLGGLGAIYPIPMLGVIIAALTIFGVSLQGAETVRAQKELDRKHASVLKEIEHAREEAASQHAEAMQEIAQARGEAAIQYAEAAQEIQKARDEARAENILLKAEKFATSLMEKDALVNEAVALNPDVKQRELKQLGIEMSIAVIDGYDPVTQRGRMVVGLGRGMGGYWKLERKDIARFAATAINYLQESVLETTMPDVDGLLYLACMYGYQQQFEALNGLLSKDRAPQEKKAYSLLRSPLHIRQMRGR